MATKSFSVAMKGFLQDELAISVGLCSAKYTESARIHQHSVEVELALAYPLSLIGLNYSWNSAACGGPAPPGIPRIPSMYSVVIPNFHSCDRNYSSGYPGNGVLDTYFLGLKQNLQCESATVLLAGQLTHLLNVPNAHNNSVLVHQLGLCAERIIVTPIEAVQARHRKFRVSVAYQAGETVLRHGH